MKKKNTEKLLNWDAHYVGIKAMKERQQNCITLEELVREVMPLLSHYAPTTIVSQIPQFTAWDVLDLTGNMVSLKRPFLSKHFNSLVKNASS
jgi:hypothetical protein